MLDYSNWLKRGLEKDGINPQMVAHALGVHHSAVYKLLDGTRSFKANEISLISRVINEPIPVSNNAIAVQVEGIVSADGWAPIKPMLTPASISVVREHGKRWSRSYTAYRVAGRCLATAPVRKDDDIACVDFKGKVRQDNLVIVERSRGKLIEHVLRSVSIQGNRIGLVSLSPRAASASLEFAGEGTRICAIAVAVNRSLL